MSQQSRLRVSLQADPKAFAERPIDPLPGAVDTPFPKVPGITSVSWTGSIYATATPSIVASS